MQVLTDWRAPLEPDQRAAATTSLRYEVIAETRRWPGPPGMRPGEGLGQ